MPIGTTFFAILAQRFYPSFMNKAVFFTKQLLAWHQPSDRPLPWKGIQNPYFIWLAEIILQQTRVEQGLPYYLKFIEKYPTVLDLAKASEDEVFKLWEGLGYYSRARNLHAAAKTIAQDYQGIFPDTYETIRSLKGVGDYTAAAIASFAYGLPYAVVDGNVYRVLARFFGIETPIDSSAGKKEFRILADSLLDRSAPGPYNQAIMDFGATHCKPKAPLCVTCLHQKECAAFKTNKTAALPVKAKKLKHRKRYFYYLVMNKEAKVLLQKRTEKDIWANLYDFPSIEMEEQVEGLFLMDRLKETTVWKSWLGKEKIEAIAISKIFKQTLSHQKISAIFIELNLNDVFFTEKENSIIIERKKIKNFAFPKIISDYLNQRIN